MRIIDTHYDGFIENLKTITEYIDAQNAQKLAFEEIILLDPEKKENLSNYLNQGLAYFELSGKLQNSPIVYNAIIISFYGFFEQYIDNVFNDYLSILSKYSILYEHLPDKIKEKHIKRLGDYLSNPQRYKNYELTPDIAISNAYNRITQNTFAFNENTRLLLAHSGNLTIEQIINLAQEFGIQSLYTEIVSDIEFKEYCCKKYDYQQTDYQRLVKTNSKGLFKPIDDLVHNRNQIAHGNCDERISTKTIKDDFIPYFSVFAKVLKDKLIANLFNVLYMNNKLFDLGHPIKVFSKHIAGINSKHQTIRIGDYIFCINSKTKKALKIESLEIKNNSVEVVQNSNEDIGIGFNVTVK